MSSEHENVESILGQMRLRPPSQQLDQRLEEIFGQSVGDEPLQSRRSRGWASTGFYLAAFGLVASLAGFLVGQLVDLKAPTSNDRQSVANFKVQNSNSTPVRFNPNAFALLHGHSTKPDYSNCKECHSTDGEMPEKYRDWFYGDSKLFKQHPKSDVSECSSCHTFDAGPKPEPFHPVPDKFKDSNCSACHLAGSTLRKPAPDSKIEEG